MPSPPPDDLPRAPSRASSQDVQAAVDVGTLVDQLPAILYVADVGTDGRWHYVSSGVESLLGFTPAEWLADPTLWARQMHPDDRERVFGREDVLAAPAEADEYRMRHRGGATIWVRDEAALVTDAHGSVRWHGVIVDITDRRLAEQELERRAEQQAAVARLGHHALEGSDVSELMLEALHAATSITGLEMGAVFELDLDAAVLRTRASVGALAAPLEPTLGLQDMPLGLTGSIEGRGVPWGVLWLGDRRAREPREADADFVQALANILADAIQQRSTEEEIRYQAAHDPLTGLPNRLLFLDRLGAALDRPESAVAVVLLDIDNFKLVNDSLGHHAGDELLVQVAPRLRGAVRPSDTVARLGGDEFVVLLEQVRDESSAAQVAERIVAAFNAPFALGAGEYFAKASLGIAIAEGEGRTPAGLFRDADAALYHAKRRGRGRYEVFDGAMRARTVERLSVENDLRRALEREELEVVYQPIISLRDGSLSSVEALLRWENHDRPPISPAEFIPVAEESGMIEAIGHWVLERACGQAARWQAAHPDSRPLGISVNLSVRQFMQRDLRRIVEQVLGSAGVDPASLCLEITESVLMEEPRGVSETIMSVSALGVRFALDDFGTGYSSLAYLSGLPIDGLKVDRSFVTSLGIDERSTAITTAIVRMAQALSLEVIAEGVETSGQLKELHRLGCEFGQGFYFHHPLSAAAVSEMLARGEQERSARTSRARSL